MTAAERLERARELLDQAVAEIDEAIPALPAYCVEAGRFLRGEVAVARRRCENVAKVIGTRKSG